MVTNRVTGLVSGLDTEALVKQMMAVSQNKYDSLMAKKTQTEWRVQLYNDIYEGLDELQQEMMSMSLSAGNNPKKTTLSDSSIADITADGNAVDANHMLVVGQLATTASLTSGGSITTGADKANIGNQLGITSGGSFTITQNGKSETISIDPGESINEVLKKINDSTNVDVSAVYDSNLDRVFFSANQSGADSSFTITGNDASGTDFVNALKLTGTSGAASNTATGLDAMISLDGATFTQSSNDFTIAGLHISLKKGPDPLTGNPVYTTVDVKSDNTKLLENVKGLIDSYNNMMELINGKTNEKVYYDYDPLTDEQKDEMSDKEIELWEEKAKSGLLKNDSILKGLTSDMRTAMYSSYNVSGDYKTLSSIGISTTSYKDKGKLTLDEEKFMKALEADPDAVSKLFSGTDGVINKLRTSIRGTMQEMQTKGGAGLENDTQSSWAQQLDRYEDQMDALAKKMKTEEERYYQQFATMEQMLSNMNNSASYLLSSLGGSSS